MSNAHVSVEPLIVSRDTVVGHLAEYLHQRTPQQDAPSSEIVERFVEQVVKNAEVFAEKQHDYGPGNIASFGSLGVLVRTNDKIARMKNLQGRVAKNEPVADAFLDTGNYGVIGQLTEAGLWPGCDPSHKISALQPSDPVSQADRAVLALRCLRLSFDESLVRLALGAPECDLVVAAGDKGVNCNGTESPPSS